MKNQPAALPVREQAPSPSQRRLVFARQPLCQIITGSLRAFSMLRNCNFNFLTRALVAARFCRSSGVVFASFLLLAIVAISFFGNGDLMGNPKL